MAKQPTEGTKNEIEEGQAKANQARAKQQQPKSEEIMVTGQQTKVEKNCSAIEPTDNDEVKKSNNR